MSHAEPRQTCLKCHKDDYTSFSTCRYCGTKYGAIATTSNEEKSTLDIKVLGVGAVLVMLFLGFQGMQMQMKAQRNKQLEPVAAEIKASGKPRLMEFYATWCCPCRNYAPTLDALQNQYGTSIDFYRMDVDNPSYNGLAQRMGVSSIPRTFLFDSQGTVLLDATGAQPREKLEKLFSDALASKANK